MVGLGLNLSGVTRGDGPDAPLTSRGDADGNVNVHEKTVDPEETRRGEASSSSGSDDDSDDDAPLAERPAPTTRPAGLPSLGLGLGARGAAAAGGSTVSSPTSPPSGTSLSARKPPGLGLRIGGDGGAGDGGAGDGRPSAIDLESLRSSGETQASELTIRREKFAHFEKHCTRVAPSVFVAGEAVARNLQTLKTHDITHVINCNAFVIPNLFEEHFTYKSLWLQDSPSEDVTRVLYDCFDFIRNARRAGGNVLVHCSQGVSRSVSVVISFLMWESGLSYEEVFKRVKAQRGIANPNMGFTCQMLQWRKRVASEIASREGGEGEATNVAAETESDPESDPRLTRVYRLAPHSEHDPRYLVAKQVEIGDEESIGDASVRANEDDDQKRTALKMEKPKKSLWTTLDARGAFVVADAKKQKAFVWVGPACVDERSFTERARAFARQLFQYDGLGDAWGTNAEEKENSQTDVEGSCRRRARRFRTTGVGRFARVRRRRLYVGRVGGRGVRARRGVRCGLRDVPSRARRAFPAKRASQGTAGKAPPRFFRRPFLRRSRLPPARCAPRPALVTYPGFDPVTMYDEDDLDSACVFVLVALKHKAQSSMDPPREVLEKFVSFVWIGRGVDDGGHADVFGARVAEECAARIAETFGETHSVRVEREGNESEAFWEHFEAGQE
jgi:protein-tyrosine phosphatase